MQAEASTSAAPVVAFDFDKTLTTRDTLRMFYIEVVGLRRFAAGLIRTAPSLTTGLVLGGQRRDMARARLTRRLLTGISASQAEAAAERVGQQVSERHLRKDVVARLRWHVRQGHRVFVVSASFDFYVRVATEGLGLPLVIATRWEVDNSSVLTGALLGANVRGARKCEVLREATGLDRIAYAYGDSAGDADMLAMSETPTWIGRSRIPESVHQRGASSLASN